MNKLKIAFRYNKTDMKFGQQTLVNQWLIAGIKDWDDAPEDFYDVVFCFYTLKDNIKAKRIILLLCDQSLKAYTVFAKKYIDSFDDVFYITTNKSIIKGINRDFKNSNCEYKAINLFKFSEDIDVIPCQQKTDRLLHLGRITAFKNNTTILKYPKAFVDKPLKLCLYGSALVDKNGSKSFMALNMLTNYNKDKTKDLLPEFNLCLNNEEPTNKINIYPSYKLEELSTIINMHKFAILFYDERMNNSAEYALLELIDNNIPVILLNSFAKNFEFCGKIYDLSTVHPTVDTLDEIYDIADKYCLDYENNIKKQKQFWKDFYRNDQIIEALLNKTV